MFNKSHNSLGHLLGGAILAGILVSSGACSALAQSGFGDLGGALNQAVGGIVPTPSAPATNTPSSAPPSRASSALGIASSAAGMLKEETPEEEIAVGKSTAAQFLGATKLVKDQRVQAYVNSVGLALTARGERASLPWKFAIVDTSSINAFAIPGGIILVTKGLYRLLQSEDELAAVLGHEIAHVQRQHHFKVIKQQKMVGAVSGALTAEVAQDQEIVATLAARATEVMARGLDKDAEYEADRDGMVLAARAGYDSSAIFSVLEKIRDASTPWGRHLRHLLHPTSTCSAYCDIGTNHFARSGGGGCPFGRRAPHSWLHAALTGFCSGAWRRHVVSDYA